MPRSNQSGGYRSQSPDTDPEAEDYLFARLRRLPYWRKAEMLSASTKAAYGLAMAGLRQRYPDASEPELRKRYAALVLGRNVSISLFGWDPKREGW
jgi:hypothetical protein